MLKWKHLASHLQILDLNTLHDFTHTFKQILKNLRFPHSAPDDNEVTTSLVLGLSSFMLAYFHKKNLHLSLQLIFKSIPYVLRHEKEVQEQETRDKKHVYVWLKVHSLSGV